MPSKTLAQIESPWPHRWAVVLVCATFPLIWVGGLVTTYGAGMAVPDWPTTYGYNLFLYPWQTWIFGPFDLFIEHGHRLLGALVGLITIAFMISVFRSDRRPWMRAVSIIALLAVIGQGTLGGMRVRLDDRQFAMLHGCVGPAFFAFSVALAIFTSRWWREVSPRSERSAVGLQSVAISTAVFTYLQLVVGATLRHFPIDVSANFFRIVVLFHLFLAAAVAGHVISLTVRTLRVGVAERSLSRPAYWLCGLIACQLILGTSTWVVKYGWPSWFAEAGFAASYTVQARSLIQSLIVTAHVATGSLILVTAVLVAVRSLRLFPILGESLTDEFTVKNGKRPGDRNRSGFSQVSQRWSTEPIA